MMPLFTWPRSLLRAGSVPCREFLNRGDQSRAGQAPRLNETPPHNLLGALRRCLHFAELLVQGIPVDAEAGGGLDEDVVAQGQDLFEQLFFHAADEPLVQVSGLGGDGLQGGANQTLDLRVEVATLAAGRAR